MVGSPGPTGSRPCWNKAFMRAYPARHEGMSRPSCVLRQERGVGRLVLVVPAGNEASWMDRTVVETKDDGQTGMMGTRWMPWRWTPMKDVATRRNALGRRWQPVIQRSPNGATPPA
jgi:hypothetical protein